MQVVYQIIMALAGLGVMLYGIRLISRGLENVLGFSFKRALGKTSRSMFKSYGLGAGTTFLLQTTLLTVTMVVGLINIGAIGLGQALAIVLGANFGSTLAMVLLAFESVNILQILSIFVIIGVAVLIFAKSEKTEKIGKVILGFGLLCLGITLLSSSMKVLSTMLNLTDLLTGLTNPALLILIGCALAIFMQSSYPVVAILIVLAGMGSLSFISCSFVLFGANLGTGITLLFLTGFGDGYNGRRVVLFNLFMKIFSVLLFTALMFIPAWADWIHNSLCGGMYAISLVVMMILFNMVPGLILLPFMKWLEKFMRVVVRQKNGDKDVFDTFELDDRVMKLPAVAQKAVVGNIAKILEMQVELCEKLTKRMLERQDAPANSFKNKVKSLEKSIKITTNNAIRIGSSQGEMEKANSLVGLLGDLSDILKVCQRLIEFGTNIKDKPRSIKNAHLANLEPLAGQIIALGHQSFFLLSNELNIEERDDKLRAVFQMDELNKERNTEAKHGLVAATEGKNQDNSLYFSILYEFGRLSTDFTDIAIKTSLMEE